METNRVHIAVLPCQTDQSVCVQRIEVLEETMAQEGMPFKQQNIAAANVTESQAILDLKLDLQCTRAYIQRLEGQVETLKQEAVSLPVASTHLKGRGADLVRAEGQLIALQNAKSAQERDQKRVGSG